MNVTTRKGEIELLHGPWPSGPEELTAAYGDTWDIYRERDTDGTHGNWIAERLHKLDETRSETNANLRNVLRAPTIEQLRRALELQTEAMKRITAETE